MPITLSDMELYIIKNRVGMNENEEEKTFKQIANELNISKEKCRQIEKVVLKKLKHPKLEEKWQEIIELKREIYDK